MKIKIPALLKYSFLLLISCRGEKINKFRLTNTIQSKYLETDTIIRIQKWLMVGELKTNTLYNTNQHLFDYNLDEKMLVAGVESFMHECEGILKIDKQNVLSYVNLPRHGYDLKKKCNPEKPSTSYFVTLINIDESKKTILALSAYQSSKIWLNGVEIHQTDLKQERFFFREDYVPIELRRGDNFLVVKVSLEDLNVKSFKWRFDADIISYKLGRDMYFKDHRDAFLQSSLIEEKKSLVAKIPFNIDEISIRSNASKIPVLLKFNNIKKRSVSVDIDSLRKGQLYQCEVISGTDTMRQDFFYGNLNLFVKDLYSKYENSKKRFSRVQQGLIDNYFKRLFLDKRRSSSDYNSQKEYWNKIRIPNLAALGHLLRHREYNGFFVKTYNSSYFKDKYHYSVFKPKRYPLRNINILFFVDLDDARDINWIDHWRSYTMSILNPIIHLAEKHGSLVVWTNAGGGGDPQQHKKIIKEIISDLGSELSLSSDNIYIIGNCNSTGMALELFRSINIFRACCLINPNLSDIDTGLNKKSLFILNSYYDEVIPHHNVLQLYRRLKENNDVVFRTSYSATHLTAPPYFQAPIFRYIDSLSTATTSPAKPNPLNLQETGNIEKLKSNNCYKKF